MAAEGAWKPTGKPAPEEIKMWQDKLTELLKKTGDDGKFEAFKKCCMEKFKKAA